MNVPLTVPKNRRGIYTKRYARVTHNSGRLFLFAADQKIEHLNDDFHGEGITPDAADPEYLFKIASQGRIGAFATHLGLVAHYGEHYRNVPYIIKLNGKTNLVPVSQTEPVNALLCTVDQVESFRKIAGLDIVGVGYTIYLGSEYEDQMMREASQVVLQAHQHGMLAILWIYPRGKAVKHERDIRIIAGAAGVGVSLGADFVKVNPPESKSIQEGSLLLKQATMAAGRSKVICSGGKPRNELELIDDLYAQLTLGGVGGCAIGRNIFTRPLHQAIRLTKAIAALIYDSSDAKEAKRLLKEGK